MAFSIYVVLNEVLNCHEYPLREIMDHYFSTDYRQRTNGHWDDRESFHRHLCKLREIVVSAEVIVLDELRNDNLYADRHRVHVVKKDGATVVQEVYLFARLDADGRALSIEETTLQLEGAEADCDLGNIK